MQVEYKTILISELPKLNEYGKEGWIVSGLKIENTIFLYREIKKTRKEKKAEQTPQYIQFKELYPKNTGITAQKIINKIDEIVQAGEFEKLMEGVVKYNKKIFLEKIVMKFVLNPETYLNNRRWEDEFSIMENRICQADQWILAFLEKLTPEQGEQVLKLRKEYEAKFKKDCTPGILQNIIDIRIFGKE